MLGLIDNALMQTWGYGIAVIGIAIAFRILRYPDLTADGSFILGASVFASVLLFAEWPWWAGLALASLAGGVAGIITGLIHQIARVNRLLSGILTTMICYSLAFRVLSERGNRSVLGVDTPFARAFLRDRASGFSDLGLHPATLGLGLVTLAGVTLFAWLLLRSEWGLVLRATGSNPKVVKRYNRQPGFYVLAGLFLANALVGFSGGLIVARDGFVDVNMGTGLIIVLIAALVVGEQIFRWVAPRLAARPMAGPALAAIGGTFLYYLFYLIILRVSLRRDLPIQILPTDLKMISALVVVMVLWIRSRSSHLEPEHRVVL